MEKISLGDMSRLAKDILARLPQGKGAAALMTLQGELGAGKTTLTQALARELGVTETVQSPTYVLMKSYPIRFGGFTKLIHIDAYRLESAAQFAALDPETFLSDPHALIVLEWPERVEGALPKPDIAVHLSSEGAGEGERYIELV